MTVHYVDPSFELRSLQIALRHMPESHTRLNLKNNLELIFSEYGISGKIVAGVSDTASNVKHALKDLMPNLVYIPCYCHVINLCVKDVLNESGISELLSKCRKLVATFKHSMLLSELLASYQEKNGLPTTTLKQDVPTRWNASYIMIASIVRNYDFVKHTVINYKGKSTGV